MKDGNPMLTQGNIPGSIIHEHLDEEEIGLPGIMYATHVVANEHDARGPERLPYQRHFGFLRRTVSFPVVARGTCGYEVLPRIFPAPRLRQNVIDRQLLPASAVLTPETIPPHDVLAGNHDALVRYGDITPEANNTGPGKLDRRGTYEVIRNRLNQIGLAQENENHGALDTAERERAIILIENEYVSAHDAQPRKALRTLPLRGKPRRARTWDII